MKNYCFVLEEAIGVEQVREHSKKWWKDTSSNVRYYMSDDMKTFYQVINNGYDQLRKFTNIILRRLFQTRFIFFFLYLVTVFRLNLALYTYFHSFGLIL